MIKLTAEEASTIRYVSWKYDSVAELMRYTNIQYDGYGEIIHSEMSQGQGVLNAIDILREQGLTKDSGLSDPHGKYTFGMFDLLSAELSNRIFEGVDYGQLPDAIAGYTVYINMPAMAEPYTVPRFSIGFDPVFSVEHDNEPVDHEDSVDLFFELWQKKGTVVTRYALDACIKRIKNAVEGVNDNE